MKSSLFALNRFVLTQDPQKRTGAPTYCLWKSDSLFLLRAWQSLQRGRPGAFSYIWFSKLACKSQILLHAFISWSRLQLAHQRRKAQSLRSTQICEKPRALSSYIHDMYVCVYTLHASCVPGKYVNILSMERNEEAVFLL